MNQTPSHRLVLPVFFAALIAYFPASAATISSLGIIDNSSANEATTTGSNRLLEWQNASNFSPVTVSDDVVSFSHQMQFYNGYHIPIGGSGFALTHKRNLLYDLTFTIDDPTNRGYTLNIDSLLRGYSAAQWLDGTNTNAVTVTGVSISGRLDTNTADASDTLDTQVSGLTLGTSGVTANQSSPSAMLFQEMVDSHTAGYFEGTLSFALRFTTTVTPTTNVFLQNNQAGQGSIRYGFNNTLTGLDPTGQAQPGDPVTDNNQLGHFITVSAEFNPEAVPEPSSISFLFASLAALSLHRRR